MIDKEKLFNFLCDELGAKYSIQVINMMKLIHPRISFNYENEFHDMDEFVFMDYTLNLFSFCSTYVGYLNNKMLLNTEEAYSQYSTLLNLYLTTQKENDDKENKKN